MTLPISVPVDHKDVEVTAFVAFSQGSYLEHDQAPIVGIFGPASTGLPEMKRDQVYDIELALPPLPRADYHPSMGGGKISAYVGFNGTPPPRPRDVSSDGGSVYDWYPPHLHSGGTLDLPLFEYFDPVQQRFGAGDTLNLTASSSEVRARPGAPALFNVTIVNHGDGAARVLLELAGTGSEGARLLGDSEARVPGNGEKAVHVALDAPGSGTADVFLLAVDGDDPTQRAAVALRAITDPSGIDAGAEVDALASPDKESPGLAPLVLLAALAWAFSRRRP